MKIKSKKNGRDQMKDQSHLKHKLVQRSPARAIRGPLFSAFTVGMCIMTLELTAGRLIAAFVGSTIYTWTSVIGVVLGGIALGNYFGGLIADRFSSRNLLGWLLVLAAITCASIPYFNGWFGAQVLTLLIGWHAKTLLHVAGIFLIPSALLGAIGPVIAKWALDQGLRTGRTVGDIYAWGMIGSVVGTFLTGFLLIPYMGTHMVMFSIAVVLMGLGLSHLARCRFGSEVFLVVTGLSTFCLGIHGVGLASGMGLKSLATNTQTIHERESHYSFIHVETLQEDLNARILLLDQLAHSFVDMRHPASLDHPKQYPYMKLYAALTQFIAQDKEKLNAFFLGGGGYVLPRYIEENWPGSYVEVAEIDSAVTETAIRHLALDPNHTFRIYHQDARNRVHDILSAKTDSRKIQKFDFIYGDTFNHLNVPFQLTTYEFNEKLAGILSVDGVYMLNLVDVYESSEFLGAVIRTLEKTFIHVAVFAAGTLRQKEPNTFVLVSSNQLNNYDNIKFVNGFAHRLSGDQLKKIRRNSKTVLTDQFAPVEHALLKVTDSSERKYRSIVLEKKYFNEGLSLVKSGDIESAIRQYEASLLVSKNRFQEMATRLNLANLLAYQGRMSDAITHYERVLKMNPNYVRAHLAMGDSYLREHQYEEALEKYEAALTINGNSKRAKKSVEYVKSLMFGERLE